jgi:hypothetical protein
MDGISALRAASPPGNGRVPPPRMIIEARHIEIDELTCPVLFL